MQALPLELLLVPVPASQKHNLTSLGDEVWRLKKISKYGVLHNRYVQVLIAMCNVFNLIGGYIPLVKLINIAPQKGIMITVLSRSLLISALYFTAKNGDQVWMIFLVSFLGLTNRHLTVCARSMMDDIPRFYFTSF